MTESVESNHEEFEGLSQEDIDFQAGIYNHSPIKALLDAASATRRHRIQVNLPDGQRMVLWARKPSSRMMGRYQAAKRSGKERESHEIFIQLIMENVDRKIADDGRPTDYVAAFPESTRPQLEQICSTVINELVDQIITLDGFSIEAAKND